ncbi:MAG: tetratricopeptide repeat protein, partial [bacterium]|nr:tetratricopeptide repeat protein [bacterium]
LVRELEEMQNASVKHIQLENLSPEAGAVLLKKLGVKETNRELLEAANDFKCHALALTLLGKYLAIVHDGEIRKRDLIPALEEEEEYGGHAKRVMKSYEIWLKGKPELALLNIMGLFDRPAEGGAIEVLREKPIIKGLTDAILNLSEPDWKFTIEHLRELRLLDERDEVQPDTLDCHPLIREHFGEKLKKENPDAWKEAHSRLYEYFRDLPKKKYPDTLEEMEPLYRAVMHGCQAGRHQETLNEIFWKRIDRKSEAYSVQKLGAYGANLAAISNFFVVPWRQLADELSEWNKAVILNWVGLSLRALGRLHEAKEPMLASLHACIKQTNWKNVAASYYNLSEIALTLGDIRTAIEYARQSVKYADQSNDLFEQLRERSTFANALHQAGELIEAKRLFQEAEKMQRKHRPDFRFLSSLGSYMYCDLLLNQRQYLKVQERVRQTRIISLKVKRLLEIALHNLSLGRASLIQAQTEKTGSFQKAAQFLDQAVQGLREADMQEFIVCGLLARAEINRLTKAFTDAWLDLEEAMEIAERGEMQLYLTDFHLEAARLFCAVGKATKTPKKAPVVQEFFQALSESEELGIQAPIPSSDHEKIAMTKAREHFAIAKKMVTEMGYGRRYPEIAELEKLLKIKKAST